MVNSNTLLALLLAPYSTPTNKRALLTLMFIIMSRKDPTFSFILTLSPTLALNKDSNLISILFILLICNAHTFVLDKLFLNDI